MFRLFAQLIISCMFAFTINAEAKDEVLTLNKRNTVVFRGVVTSESVMQAELELVAKSAKLEKSEVIYLVLDTPGGDVDSGMAFIDFMKALPNKVKTITVFAASMGFTIVQNSDERLILPNGVLMSHRAKISGASGEIPGELITRLKFILRDLNEIDRVSAKRMKIPVTDYQELIRDEYWVKGFESTKKNASDRTILARCDDSFNGTSEVVIGSFFGIEVLGDMSNCPFITGVMNVHLAADDKSGTKEQRSEALKSGNLYKTDRRAFVNTYISSGKLVYFQK